MGGRIPRVRFLERPCRRESRLISRFAPHRERSTKDVLALSAALGSAAFIGLVLLGPRTPVDVLLALVASLAAAATAALVVWSPITAFGLLVILASISGLIIAMPFGRVRLEQPSIVAAVVALVAIHSWPRRSNLALVVPIAGSFALYLIVLTVASIIHAPQIAVSARLITWWTLSISAGVVAFVLVQRSGARGEGWFTAVGVGHAATGIVIATAFLFLGPTGIPGMQTSPGEVPKVVGLAFEANLYASMLGAFAPFAIERYRARRSPTAAVPVVLIVVGLGLGVTRGAYIGLAAGLGVYLAIVAFRRRPRVEILGVLPVLAIALLLAPSIAWVMLPARQDSGVIPPTPGASAGATPVPDGFEPSLAPVPTPATDNIAFRLNRIPVAINDLEESPIIGLGAGTFGQRHVLPDRPGVRDYISMLALSAVYEAGVIGAAALALGFLLSLRLILRASRYVPGLAAAYGASTVSLLVAYEASNAIFFSIIWIILGAGLAMASQRIQGASPSKVGAAPAK